MTTTQRPTPNQAALALQARARDRALVQRLERLERVVARVQSRIDGATVTWVAEAEARRSASTRLTDGRRPAPD